MNPPVWVHSAYSSIGGLVLIQFTPILLLATLGLAYLLSLTSVAIGPVSLISPELKVVTVFSMNL